MMTEVTVRDKRANMNWKIANLDPGDIFVTDISGELMMVIRYVTHPVADGVAAVELRTGYVREFKPDVSVTLCRKVEISIE